MSSTVPKQPLVKHHYQNLVTMKDSSIALIKPPNAQSELWSNFSQLYYHLDVAQSYIVCNECCAVSKWTSETGTKVMKNHTCGKKSTSTASTTPSPQHTISSYLPPAQDNYAIIKERIVNACVECCALDNKPFDTVAGQGFVNLAKQLMNSAARIGPGFSVKEILLYPTTVTIKLSI